MANKLFQNVINQMKDVVCGRVFGVVDEGAVVVSCSDQTQINIRNDKHLVSLGEFDSQSSFDRDGFTYKPFGNHGSAKADFAVFMEGKDEFANAQVNMIAISLSLIKQYHDEKYDRNNFIKNIILDNVLPGDIGIKSRELHFNVDVCRTVFLINIGSKSDVSAFEVVQNLFPDKNKDFVFNISEHDIVLVKELKPTHKAKELEKLAKSISDTLAAECFSNVSVGIGDPIHGIKDLARSFKEAQMSIEVGKVFDTDKNIICYSNLGIARLIYFLPTTLCNSFLCEVFKRGSVENLDHETLFTIQRFFENSLNVSETSRKLFVHRNTLVYRLDKIKKMTGLDLREFEDAIVFKIALMVKKFIATGPAKY